MSAVYPTGVLPIEPSPMRAPLVDPADSDADSDSGAGSSSNSGPGSGGF